VSGLDGANGAIEVGLGEDGVFDRRELDAGQVPFVRRENDDGFSLGQGILNLLFGDGNLGTEDEGVGGGSLGEGFPDVGVHVRGTKLGFSDGFQGIASGASRIFIRRENNRNVFFSSQDFSSLLVFLNRLKACNFGVGFDDTADLGLLRFRNATDSDDDTVKDDGGFLWGVDLSSLSDFLGGIDGGNCGRGDVIIGNFGLCSLFAGHFGVCGA
jgi:hypothetical protein